MKDKTNKERSQFKKQTKEGIENWKKRKFLINSDIKSNPNEYHQIDKFFDGKNEKKQNFGRGLKQRGGDRQAGRQNRQNKQQSTNRPGKVRRMMHRNKKNSMKTKKK